MSSIDIINRNIDAVRWSESLQDFGRKHWHVRIENWQPTTTNKLLTSHYFVAGRHKKADREMIAYYCKDIPKAQKKRFIGVTIELGYRQRGADVDAYHKSLLDALVHAEIIKDDSKEWVEIAPIHYIRGKNKATTIRISEVA